MSRALHAASYPPQKLGPSVFRRGRSVRRHLVSSQSKPRQHADKPGKTLSIATGESRRRTTQRYEPQQERPQHAKPRGCANFVPCHSAPSSGWRYCSWCRWEGGRKSHQRSARKRPRFCGPRGWGCRHCRRSWCSSFGGLGREVGGPRAEQIGR